jgi:hypothetical protein
MDIRIKLQVGYESENGANAWAMRTATAQAGYPLLVKALFALNRGI